MPAGLQVFDQYGNLKIDLGHRLLRFIGSQIIINPGDSSYVDNDGLLTGTPSYLANMFSSNSSSYWPGEGLLGPSISFSGNRMYYSLSSGLPTQIVQMVVY